MDSNQNSAQVIEQIVIVNPEAPWLLENGKITPEAHLRSLTPGWNAETWEKYLSWFQSQEGQRAESLVSVRRYIELSESKQESVFDFSQSAADDDLRALVSQYLSTLTEQQQRVIEMIFWDGRSERFVANALAINQKSVHRLKIRAVNKIKVLLKGGLTSRIMKGENSPITKGGTDERNHRLADSDLAEAG